MGGTIGFMSMGAFVGKVYGKGELSCTQVESGKSSLNDNDVYVAEASCPNDYTIFDCNGYLDSQIDYCTVDTCDSASNIKLYAADYDPMRFNVGEWSYDGEFNGYPSYAKANGNLGRDMYIYVKNGGYELSERKNNEDSCDGSEWVWPFGQGGCYAYGRCDGITNIGDCGTGTWELSTREYLGEEMYIVPCGSATPPHILEDQVFGEMIDGDKCVASGNTHQVRVQANCCRVSY